MDENLKKIKNMLLEYTTKKIFPNEINGMEAKTLSEIYEEVKRKNEDDSDIKPFAEYLVNQKYFKDELGSYYSFESYNKKMIRYNIIEPTKYTDYDENEEGEQIDCWYNQKTVTYSEGCRNIISSERVLDKYRKLKPISAEEYNLIYLKVKLFSNIKRNITLKENKINEQIKRVKFLGISLRLCEYTKNMTQEEYIKLANLIDEETQKDVKKYLDYLNSNYKGKYVYIHDRGTLHLYKVDSFELVDRMIQLHTNKTYSISPTSAYKTICNNQYERVELIIDIVDENTIKEIDELIESFFK